MNKEPQEVDWSKQKPGTIGVTRWGHQFEFIASRGIEAVFYNEHKGWATKTFCGRKWTDKELPDDILLPWESQIAEGHNPGGLTNTQAGDGWRLANLGEPPASNAEIWNGEKWNKRTDVGGSPYFPEHTYRVPITKPKRRVPCGPEHFPPGVVLRQPGAHALWQVVTKVRSSQLMTPNYDGELNSITFKRLVEDQVERSIDGGKTWLPCYVETEE